MTSSVSLDHQTLQSFFFAELEDAQERNNTSLPLEVSAYVVDLLTRFARRPGVAGRTAPTLALQFLGAKQASGSRRASALRQVGDRALYIAGVVPRSMERRAVDVRYVQSIGATAYHEVAGARALAVFGQLAQRFVEVATVMGDAVEAAANDAPDLLQLYERWRAHGSDRDLRALIRAGVVIDPEGSDTLQ